MTTIKPALSHTNSRPHNRIGSQGLYSWKGSRRKGDDAANRCYSCGSVEHLMRDCPNTAGLHFDLDSRLPNLKQSANNSLIQRESAAKARIQEERHAQIKALAARATRHREATNKSLASAPRDNLAILPSITDIQAQPVYRGGMKMKVPRLPIPNSMETTVNQLGLSPRVLPKPKAPQQTPRRRLAGSMPNWSFRQRQSANTRVLETISTSNTSPVAGSGSQSARLQYFKGRRGKTSGNGSEEWWNRGGERANDHDADNDNGHEAGHSHSGPRELPTAELQHVNVNIHNNNDLGLNLNLAPLSSRRFQKDESASLSSTAPLPASHMQRKVMGITAPSPRVNAVHETQATTTSARTQSNKNKKSVSRFKFDIAPYGHLEFGIPSMPAGSRAMLNTADSEDNDDSLLF